MVRLYHLVPLSEAFTNELQQPSFDLAVDYLEISLDSILEEGLLKEVPLVKTVYSLFKGYCFIRELHFVKKLLGFLREVHVGSEPDKLRSFVMNLKNNEAFRTKAAEYLLVAIERTITIDKVRILANLFLAHVEGHYDWDRFVDLSICLDSLHPNAYDYIHKLASADPRFVSYKRDEERGLLIAAGIGEQDGNMFRVNKLGRDLYEYGIAKWFRSTEKDNCTL